MRFASIQCSKMRLWPGLHPGPRWWSLQRSPDSLAGFKEDASRRGREGRERKGKRRGREGSGREGGEGDGRLILMRSWNRAADWLRPALQICDTFVYSYALD